MDSPDVLRFSVFEVDLERAELRKAGRRVPIQQQPWKALVLLATRPGRVVTRDELRQSLWPDGTHVDFDRGINFCLNQVRNALGDPARASHFIETLPRVGYRFVADVHGLEPAAVAPDRPMRADRTDGPLRDAEPPRPAVRAPHRWLAAACAIALALASGDGAPGRASALPAPSTGSAAAQAALARVMLEQHECGLRPADDVMPRARAAALAALREDPRHADARVSLALVKLHYDWDWDAGDDLERALDLAPGLARAHLARAAYFSSRGDADAAIDAARRAAALDPLCPTLRGDLASYYYAGRRYGEAADEWRRSVALMGDGGPRDRLVDALRHQGRLDEAWSEAVATMRHAGVPSTEVDALARRGPESALRAFLSGGADLLETRGASPLRLAALHASAGEDGRALALLERAVRERSWGLLAALASDPDLALLEGQLRFDRLLRETGLRPPLMALFDAPHPAR